MWLKLTVIQIFQKFNFSHPLNKDTDIKHKYLHLTARFRTTICSAFLPVLELCSLASRGQYASATGQRLLQRIQHRNINQTRMRVASNQ